MKTPIIKITLLCSILGLLSVCPPFAGKIFAGLNDQQKEVPTNEWGAVIYSTQISIGINSNEKEFKTNQVVRLLVRINNLSTNEGRGIYLERTFTFTRGLSFVVISPSGKDISPVFHETDRASGEYIWVPPGKIDGFSFALGEICKTDEIGIYKIILTMRQYTPDREKYFEIVSKPLEVKIVPGEWKSGRTMSSQCFNKVARSHALR